MPFTLYKSEMVVPSCLHQENTLPLAPILWGIRGSMYNTIFGSCCWFYRNWYSFTLVLHIPWPAWPLVDSDVSVYQQLKKQAPSEVPPKRSAWHVSRNGQVVLPVLHIRNVHLVNSWFLYLRQPFSTQSRKENVRLLLELQNLWSGGLSILTWNLAAINNNPFESGSLSVLHLFRMHQGSNPVMIPEPKCRLHSKRLLLD